MNKIFYVLSSVALSALAVSCQKETEFKIEGTPNFTISVGSDVIVDTDSENFNYTLNLAHQEYSAKKSVKTGNDDVLASSVFEVRSNLRWKIAPAGENEVYDWVSPFPAVGEKDGKFIFKASRNLSNKEDRDAYFYIWFDKGNGFEELPGLITVHQSKSPDFVELSEAKYDVNATAKKLKLTVLANVDWDYSLEPMEEYATDDVDWIMDANEHVASKHIDTLNFTVSANEGGLRGASLKVTYKLNETEGVKEYTDIIPIIQYPATEASVEGFPVQWAAASNDYPSWASEHKIAPVTGDGQIYYHVIDRSEIGGKTSLDVSGKNPRVNGAWPGDYLEFKANSPISAGSIVKLKFEARTSGSGLKLWRLQYKDGEEWKDASKLITRSITGDTNNKEKPVSITKEVSYTHQFKGGSSDADNDVITAVVNYANTTDAVVFRLICAANWTGSQWQEVPNTSSFRLAYTADSENQPEISVIAAGTEDVSKPDILVSGLENNIITFEGVPEGTKKFTVTSTSAFTLTPNVDWITLSETAGDADDAKTIVVTCKESTSSSLRKGQIDIKSGVSHYYITVVQSAAGGDLDPLISISDGNKKTISGKGEEFTVRVQANVDFQTEISDSWITAVPVVSTKAMVESKTLKFKAEANATGAARTATIRFYNGNIESVLTVDQDKFEPEVNITSYSGVTTISGFGETKKFTVQSNVPFTVTAPSWIKLPAAGVPEAGTYPISVQFEANTAAETRDGEIVFANADYGYEYKLNVSQAASGVYYFDDFMWIKPWADAYGSGDSVGENNAKGKAPNIYTQPTQTGLLEKFAEIGYEMLNPDAKSAYSQKYYMKLGATSKHHGLKLPAIAAADGSDVTLSFDWSPHMTGSGNIDKVELVVEIKGDGQIVTAAGTAKTSDVLVNDWKKGQLKWKNVSVKINGLKATDRISIRPTSLKDHDGITQQRWYIDNIQISK
ncbi:MAG: BACON domain-containing protein [Bacteroides sp.]|nr:BACON domain-containing protein [Bacteroides sp.]